MRDGNTSFYKKHHRFYCIKCGVRYNVIGLDQGMF